VGGRRDGPAGAAPAGSGTPVDGGGDGNEYEAQRRLRIEQNQLKMRELGLDEGGARFLAAVETATAAAVVAAAASSAAAAAKRPPPRPRKEPRKRQRDAASEDEEGPGGEEEGAAAAAPSERRRNPPRRPEGRAPPLYSDVEAFRRARVRRCPRAAARKQAAGPQSSLRR